MQVYTHGAVLQPPLQSYLVLVLSITQTTAFTLFPSKTRTQFTKQAAFPPHAAVTAAKPYLCFLACM